MIQSLYHILSIHVAHLLSNINDRQSMLSQHEVRPCTIIGNWKMHKTIEEARTFVAQLISSQPNVKCNIGLAVPFTMIYPIAQECAHSIVTIGAQTMNDVSQGAFTGEIAGKMLIDAGAKFVILGHSERRLLYGEDDALINRKIKRAIEIGLQPLLCIGETKEEYEKGTTQQVIEKQLQEDLKDIPAEQLANLIIAYEPIWAIGSGQSASPEIAQSVHAYCRELLAKMYNQILAQRIVIQYGGSVDPENAPTLLSKPDIDGLLIGGASLSLESFLKIVNNDT